jgi:type IV pilus assembly protein PilC
LSEAAVKAVLRKYGIISTKVKEKPKSWGLGGKPIETADIVLFARQLAKMMNSGIHLIDSLGVLGQGHEKPAFRRLVMAIKSRVEAGETMADALREHPQYFDSACCILVETGEQAGKLESLLTQVASYKEKNASIKKKLEGALNYPISILIAAMISSVIFLWFVVPELVEMSYKLGVREFRELPGLIQNFVVIANYNLMKILYNLLFVKIVFGNAKQKSVKFQEFLQRLSLKLPLFGELLIKLALTRFTRILATRFAAGTPLVEAMDSAAGATGNIVFYQATMKIKEEMIDGITLAESMRNTGIFPNMCVQMTQIGEKSNRIGKILNNMADYYEEEVDALVESLSAMMEFWSRVFLITIAFLSVFIIGGVVLAMYPIISRMCGV